jgi:hypothetical protein
MHLTQVPPNRLYEAVGDYPTTMVELNAFRQGFTIKIWVFSRLRRLIKSLTELQALAAI